MIKALYSGAVAINCTATQCWQPHIEILVNSAYTNELISDVSFDQQGRLQIDQLIAELVRERDLTTGQADELKTLFNQEIDKLPPEFLLNKQIEQQLNAQSQQPPQTIAGGVDLEEQDTDEGTSEDNKNSPMFWFFDMLNDLGLGFGFSAVYFSCFTAWFSGQTLGKRLLNIQVIQLDNTPLSLWKAFGGYGGYGAGLATGLLGFFQIYWDFNRQAIQDKIAATVVIDLGLKTKKLH